MKYKLGQVVRIGGPQGAVMRITDYRDGVYEVEELDPHSCCTGYLTEDYLYPFKEVRYEQLSLF